MSAAATAPPTTVVSNPVPIATNDLLPQNNNLGNCVGLAESANCGSKARADGHTYLVFLAPGLMAANMMQTAASEGTFPIMGGFVWTRRFHAMHSAPLEPDDIAPSHQRFESDRRASELDPDVSPPLFRFRDGR